MNGATVKHLLCPTLCCIRHIFLSNQREPNLQQLDFCCIRHHVRSEPMPNQWMGIALSCAAKILSRTLSIIKMPPRRATTKQDGGRKTIQYTRTVPTNQYRLAVVTHFEQHSMSDTLERFFSSFNGSARETKRKSVYYWAKKKIAIAVQATSNQRRVQASGIATTLP